MDRRELVEKMCNADYEAWNRLKETVQPRGEWKRCDDLREWDRERMKVRIDAALSVAIEELLKEPAFEEKKQVATDYFANHAHYALEAFIASRRSKLERIKTPSHTAKAVGSKMLGVTFNSADADYLINEVIRSTAPGYVPPFLKEKN